MTATPKPSPPHPPPASDSRESRPAGTLAQPVDHAQSPNRANMDPLPPAVDHDLSLGVEGARLRPQGAEHRDDVAEQRPVPSERLFPPVEDDRVQRP